MEGGLNRSTQHFILEGKDGGRDKHNRFIPYNYIVRDIPKPDVSGAPTAPRSEPQRYEHTGNKKEEIKTDFTKPFPKPHPTAQAEPRRARQDKYSEFGQRALASGNYPVFVGSEPHRAWCTFRGNDGMPGFVDHAFIDGKSHQIVWMPSVYPPKRSPGGGGHDCVEE